MRRRLFELHLPNRERVFAEMGPRVVALGRAAREAGIAFAAAPQHFLHVDRVGAAPDLHRGR